MTETVSTSIEGIDESVWRHLRADATLENGTVAGRLEEVLRQYYRLDEDGERLRPFDEAPRCPFDGTRTEDVADDSRTRWQCPDCGAVISPGQGGAGDLLEVDFGP